MHVLKESKEYIASSCPSGSSYIEVCVNAPGFVVQERITVASWYALLGYLIRHADTGWPEFLPLLFSRSTRFDNVMGRG
jgi:hypothetical protein